MVLKQPLLALLSQRLSLEMLWPKPEVTILQKRHSQKLGADPACSGLRFSELGNMLCFLLSLIPRPFSPGPFSLVLGVWVLWK